MCIETMYKAIHPSFFYLYILLVKTVLYGKEKFVLYLHFLEDSFFISSIFWLINKRPLKILTFLTACQCSNEIVLSYLLWWWLNLFHKLVSQVQIFLLIKFVSNFTQGQFEDVKLHIKSSNIRCLIKIKYILWQFQLTPQSGTD